MTGSSKAAHHRAHDLTICLPAVRIGERTMHYVRLLQR
jgi:hypothetical protein